MATGEGSSAIPVDDSATSLSVIYPKERKMLLTHRPVHRYLQQPNTRLPMWELVKHSFPGK